MEKLTMKNIEKKLNMDLPIIITIKYSNTGSSLRVINNLDELNQYRMSKDVLLSDVLYVKEIDGINYVEARLDSYFKNNTRVGIYMN